MNFGKGKLSPAGLKAADANPTILNSFCKKLSAKTPLCAKTQLKTGNAEVFKAYLTWRRNKSRVRKESSMRSYWKRLSMYYKNLTGHNMNKELLEDVCNVSYTYSELV